jgi:hypothetical protein
MLMVSCYTLEICRVIWMQYKSICENLTNMFQNYTKFAFISKNIHPIYDLIEIQLLWCFHWIVLLIWIYPWNLIAFIFFAWLLYYKMLALQSPKMVIEQCFKECWIIVWILLKNIKTKCEWNL